MDDELRRLTEEQAKDDTHWQMPEPGVVSYDREGTIEGFVTWFNRETKRQAHRSKAKRKDVLTDARRELMALALIRRKHGWRPDDQEEVQPGAGVHRLEDQPG